MYIIIIYLFVKNMWYINTPHIIIYTENKSVRVAFIDGINFRLVKLLLKQTTYWILRKHLLQKRENSHSGILSLTVHKNT